MTSKLFQSLSMVAAIGLALIGSPRPSDARNYPARGGSSTSHADSDCWSPFGGTVTNLCSTPRFWFVPLLLDGSNGGWVTVTAQGANNAANVSCRAVGFSKDGLFLTNSGFFNLTQFGPASDINVFASVPWAGTAMIDCLVGPGGKVHTVTW
ncbi:MAG TPA: hypothetical protein VK698_21535 [Kofleriaceae bacterium]|nr:hypothetical protein [Kofleriaceae bacterium]